MAVKIIVDLKDGVMGNVIVVMLLTALSGFVVWWGVSHDRVVLFIAPIACFAWLYVSFVLVRNIRRPKSFILGIDRNCLVWALRSSESASVKEGSIPIRLISALEFVLPGRRFEGGVRDCSLADIFIIDVHGNRHQLPGDLLPGIYRDEIITAIKAEKSDVRVIERMDDALD